MSSKASHLSIHNIERCKLRYCAILLGEVVSITGEDYASLAHVLVHGNHTLIQLKEPIPAVRHTP